MSSSSGKHGDEGASFARDFHLAAMRAGLRVLAMGESVAVLDYHGAPRKVDLANLRSRWRDAAPGGGEGLLFLLLTAPFDDSPMGNDAPLDEVRRRVLPTLGPPAGDFAGLVKARVPTRPIIEGKLDVCLAVDERATLSYVLEGHLEKWSISFEDLFAEAMVNLRARSNRRALEAFRGANAYFYASGDSYDASRALILRDLLMPWPQAGVLVSIPTRNHLMVVPLGDPDVLRALGGIFRVVRDLPPDAPYRVSDQAFWFDGDGWEVLPCVHGHGVTRIDPSPRLAPLLGTPGSAL